MGNNTWEHWGNQTFGNDTWSSANWAANSTLAAADWVLHDNHAKDVVNATLVDAESAFGVDTDVVQQALHAENVGQYGNVVSQGAEQLG